MTWIIGGNWEFVGESDEMNNVLISETVLPFSSWAVILAMQEQLSLIHI